jgi:hypothetical protein
MVSEGSVRGTASDKLITTVTTYKTTEHIPEDRRPLWNDLLCRGSVGIVPGQWNWSSGAVRRTLLASQSDILVTIGGGEGVEHYASLFCARSRPVIPLDLEIGSSSDDGRGGSLRILESVRYDPRHWYPNEEAQALVALLQGLTTCQGQSTPDAVANAIVHMLVELQPPSAFYVRLLNHELPEFNEVEQFYRQVIDPFVQELDYCPVQMGRTPATKPLLDAEIFGRIRESTLVVAETSQPLAPIVCLSLVVRWPWDGTSS